MQLVSALLVFYILHSIRSFKSNLKYLMTIGVSTQDFTLDKRADMPSCNLAEDCAWLKSGASGKGPDKGTLRLRSAQRSSDPKFIAEAVRNFPWAEDLLTKTGGLEDVEIFGYTKCKLDMLPGSSQDFQWSDTMNYSILRDGRRVTRAHIEEALGGQESSVLHTTSVLEIGL